MWPSLLWLTLFQLLAALQLAVSAGASVSPSLFLLFPGLPTVMWTYYLALRRCAPGGSRWRPSPSFSPPSLLAVTASSAPGSVLKQFIAILLGLTALVVLGVWLRDTSRTQRLRWLMAAAAIALLSVTLVLGQTRFGAANWIILGPLSFQPSEVAKIFYIFAGSATLERLFHRRNLGLFMVLTGGMSALSGADERLRHRPHLLRHLPGDRLPPLRRLRHPVPDLRRGPVCRPAGPQLQALHLPPLRLLGPRLGVRLHHRLSADPGHVGRRLRRPGEVGAGEGWLHTVPAADTDLVFGMLCEEWGLLIAPAGGGLYRHPGLFAARACRVGRSTFYTIAACAAAHSWWCRPP